MIGFGIRRANFCTVSMLLNLINFNNSFVLFVHFLCVNKQNVKTRFTIKFILHSTFKEFIYISKYKMLH